MKKNNIKRKSLRPECGANAPTFLSAVYKKGTQAKKRQAGAPQYGRSMIEMLGVLAIIGVLSVGGIMGYSKAMMRYKINKTIEQITYIAGNIRTTFANQRNYEDVSDNIIWKKAHIFPEDMWKEGQDNPQDMWGGNVYLDYMANGFEIYYDGDAPEEACIELLTHDWRDAQVKIIYVNNGSLEYNDIYLLPPTRLEDAVKICSDSDKNDLEMHYIFNVDTSYWKDQIDATTAQLAGN